MRFLISVWVLFGCLMANAQDARFEVCPLKVGGEIPETTLIDAMGNDHALADLIQEKPTVVIFYRGAWCGYCTKHLAELNDIKNQVEGLGYQLFGVTPDQPSKLIESSKKSDSEIVVYSDSNLATIQAFGLDWKVDDALFTKYKNEYKLDLEAWSGTDHHSLPVPAVYVIKDGIIQFQYVNPNHSIRLKGATLLAVLETL